MTRTPHGEGLARPLGTEYVLRGSGAGSYAGRVLLLDPDVLREEYRYAEFQYFYAESGFGCDPSKLGSKIFGRFLYDGERTAFRRQDFLGIADPSKMPAWAQLKTAELGAGEECENEDQSLSG